MGNSMGHIQTKIDLWISIEKIQNLSSNLSSECLLSKTSNPHQKIPNYSKFIVETVTEGNFSTYF